MKKTKIAFVISILAVTVLSAIVLVWYHFSTMSVKDCIRYCRENTMREATSFIRIGDGRYAEDYAYWIASNGDSSKSQEIFVFKKKSFGLIHVDRYRFVTSSTQSNSLEGGTQAGSIRFFTLDDEGEKETGETLLFFGVAADSGIVKYEYTLTVAEGSNVYKGRVRKGGPVWYVKFFDLKNTDENTKKVITEVKFYDADDNLICTY